MARTPSGIKFTPDCPAQRLSQCRSHPRADLQPCFVFWLDFSHFGKILFIHGRFINKMARVTVSLEFEAGFPAV
jgi:hypothetical protein